METIIFEVTFKDGRVFRVFCANSKQKREFQNSFNDVKHLHESTKVITSGVNTLKEWKTLISGGL